MRELFTCLSDEEIVEFALPRVGNVVLLVDVFVEGTFSTGDIFSKLVKFREELCLHFPEFRAFFYLSLSHIYCLDPKQKFVDIVLKNKPLNVNVCEWFLEIAHGFPFRDYLMPLALKREHTAFREFSSGNVGSFGISQKETQDIVRNKWGKHWKT